MNIPRMAHAVGHIDEELIEAAVSEKKTGNKFSLKWGAFAACVALLLIAVAIPTALDKEKGTPPVGNESTTPTTTANSEFFYTEGYFYRVREGAFSTYMGGKVISEEKIDTKIADVSVKAGWKNNKDEWISTEDLRGEVYGITGIPENTAVALKFLDKGEAITTTHYYVIMNPTADLSAVEEYVIPPIIPNTPGEESAIIPE